MKITIEDVRDILDVRNFVQACNFIQNGRMCENGQIWDIKVVGKTPKGRDKTKAVLIDCSHCQGTGYILNQNGEAFLNLIDNLNDVKKYKKIYLPIKHGYDGY